MNNKKFYAVKRGLNTGIFNTWEECEKQVIGVEGALFKSFWTKKEAEDYLKHALSTNTFNQDDTYYLYIDGYYENNRYGWGFVIYKDNKLVDTFNGESISEDNTGLYEMAGQIQAAMKEGQRGAQFPSRSSGIQVPSPDNFGRPQGSALCFPP